MIELSVIFIIVSGVILFLYGIDQFSKEILQISGEKFRSFLKNATKSTVRATILGAMVTAIIQSSTSTSVITLGLVNSGMISFTQSLGIIFGANIGTTLTSQLVAIKFASLGPFFIFTGFILGMINKRFFLIGKIVFYFGLLFFGLDLASNAAVPLHNDPVILSYLSNLSNTSIAVFVGFIVTNIFQSSSAFTGLVVVLAGKGFLSTEMIIPLILGSNLPTLTPLIASFNLGLFAKRTAIAQVLFNVLGVILILLFLPYFALLITSIGGSLGQQAANAHTLFNVITVMVFLLVLKPFENLVMRVMPGDEKEILFQTAVLTDKLPLDKKEAFTQIEGELRYLFSNSTNIFNESMNMLLAPKKDVLQRVIKRENLIDYLDERIEKTVTYLSHKQLTKKEALRAVILIRISNVLEQFSDISMRISYIVDSVPASGLTIPNDAFLELKTIYSELNNELGIVGNNLPMISNDKIILMRKNEIRIRKSINLAYKNHLERMRTNKIYAEDAFIKIISRLESSHAKIREIRKLEEMYNKL